VSVDVPIDTEGYCIYHSQDLGWKYKQGGFQYFTELIGEGNTKRAPTEYYGLQIVGKRREEHLHKMFEDKVVLLNDVIVPDDLTFFDCVFHDEVYLENIRFFGTTAFHGCEFKSGVEVHRCRFDADLDVMQSCIFQGPVFINNGCTFNGPIQIDSNYFFHNFDVDNCMHLGPVYIADNQFKNEDEAVAFSCIFKNGFTFRDNELEGYLSFQECQFFEENMIRNLSYNADFQMQECEYYGSMLFQGTEQKLQFSPNSTIEVNQNQFNGSARFTFDYCDMLNLNDEFIGQVKELEQLQLVKLNPTCKTHRFIKVIVYDTREITDILLEDYIRVVSRYFSHLFSSSLDIRYERFLEEPKMKVTFVSNDDLSAVFDRNLRKTLMYMDEKPSQVNDDLALQLSAIFERIKIQLKQRLIGTDSVNELLSLKDVNGLSPYLININMKNINQINTGNYVNQQLNVGDVDSIKLNNVKELAQQAKADLEKAPGFTADELQNACDMIDEILHRYEKEGKEAVKPWLTKALLDTAGSVASIASLLQGMGLL